MAQMGLSDILGWKFRELLIAFYGDDYKHVLAKGKITGKEDVIKVLDTVNSIEKELDIVILKGDKS